MIQMKEYAEKTYAAWLGKIIGIRLGAPVEGWSAQEIKDTYGKVNGYLVDYGTFAADDDSNGPLFFVRALEDCCSSHITAKQMGGNVLNWLCDGHGFFWWGGDGIATEHTAYNRLKAGMEAPMTGNVQIQGQDLAEQIGGQIFSDCWGYVAPNNPELASNLAAKMSSVSHDLDGIEGGKFVAVAIALAYGMKDAKEIVKKALTYLNPQSTYVMLCQEIITEIEKNPKNSEIVLDYIQTHHGYDHYPGICHILPNTAIMIWALFYGNNDFDQTMKMLCEAGWDTDCTLGNVGSIMGAMLGLEGIDEAWIKPIQDILLSSSCMGSDNIDTVSRTALYFCKLGYKLQGLEVPSEYTSDKHQTNFILPRSTGGFRLNAHRYFEANLVNHNQKLKVIVNNIYPDTTGRIFQKTYYSSSDVYDSRYEPSFSPVVYPGESLIYTISNPLKMELEFSVYAIDDQGNERSSDPVFVADKTTEFCLALPSGSYIVCEVGIKVVAKKRMMRQFFYIEKARIIPSYNYAIEFNKTKMENWGIDFGDLHRSEVAQCVTHHGSPYTDEKGLHLDGMIIFGDRDGQLGSFEIEFDKSDETPLTVAFDVNGAMNYKAITICQNSVRYEHKVKGLTTFEEFFCERTIKAKFALKIDRNRGLIKIALEQGKAEFIDNTLTAQTGAIALICDAKEPCVIVDCKLESSN